KRRIGRLCPADEKFGRLVVGERRNGELTLGSNVQRCATRHNDLELRRRVEQSRDRSRGGEDLLEVVDQQKQLGIGERRSEQLLRVLARLGNLQCFEYRARDEVGI